MDISNGKLPDNPDFIEHKKLESYKESRKNTLLYNVAGPVVFVLLFILKVSATLLTILLILYPLFGIFIIHFYSGYIALIGKKTGYYSSIFFGMIAPALLMIIESLTHFEILSYDNFWIPFMSISVLMLIAFYYTIKASKFFTSQWLFAAVIAFCFGYGSILQVNTVFDNSKTQVFTAPVTGHYIQAGRNYSYHLLLSNWTNHPEPIDVSVFESFYRSTMIGSNVDVHLNDGFFNIPYFFVSK
jgi:hypothetical protein